MAQDAAIEFGSWRSWHSEDVPLRLGASLCLLGHAVRFDAGHAKDKFVVDTLGRWFEFVPTCPEMDIGMGVPRPTIRLVDNGQGTRLVAPTSGEDFTDRMNAYAKNKIEDLAARDLDGYILKKNSPSCGLERIPVYRNGKVFGALNVPPTATGSGAYGCFPSRVQVSKSTRACFCRFRQRGHFSDPA